MTIQTYTFPNNIRLLHVQEASEVAYAGVVVNTGTRDELLSESGYAHLTEHMLFKGTSKRNSTQIINRLEDVGGELNAYTSKEETVVYSVFLKQYLQRAVELLADVVFNSVINESDLEKEIDVVIDEIHSYMDSPSELIVDDFEDELFSSYSIGRNILGSEASLKACTPSVLKDFIKRTYTTDEMVFFTLGDFSLDKIMRLVWKHISSVPSSSRLYKRETPFEYTPRTIEKDKKTLQTHYILGNRAFSAKDENRFPFYLLNNILGGQGMNSKLNMALRERNGLVYTVESHFTPYCDTGAWSVYFGADHADVPKAVRLIQKELSKLKEQPVSETKLKHAKQQLLGQMVIAGENKESWIISTAKYFLMFNTVMPKAEMEARISNVSAMQLCEVANQCFQADKFTHLRYY